MALTFDDELRRAFDALGGRLRDQIAEALASTATDALAAAAADRERMAADLAGTAREQARVAAEEARAEAERAAAAHLTSAVAAAEQRARLESEQQADDRTRAAVEAAVAAARAQAPPPDGSLVRLLESVRAIDEMRSLTDTLGALVAGAAAEGTRAALLLIAGDRMRGVNASGFDPSFDIGAIDVPLATAGLVASAARSRSTAAAAGSAAGTLFGTLALDQRAVAVPVLLAGQPVAVLYADEAASNGHRAPAWSSGVEVLTRHAARRLEALTAFMATRALLGTAGSAVGTRPESGPPNGTDDDAAQRYARLLVSEIKLYHEADVAAGREHRDLTSRLGGEIARARSVYEQRVPAAVRARVDYFGAELVRTLAGGDAGALGVVG